MKKQANTKPLTSTQIKLLLSEMIRIHNEKVDEKNVAIRRLRTKQGERYEATLREMFEVGGFSKPQIDELIRHCDATSNRLGVCAIVGEKRYNELNHYREKNWGSELHPLHAILERTKLRLHMGSASDYETYLKEFTTEIEKLLK